MLDIQNEIRVPTPLIEIREELFNVKGLKVFVKADYLTHPQLSGNKWRKLKYNLVAADKLGKTNLLSFGGAYSNHVYALAVVAKNTPFNVHCIIRGDELNPTSNETLKFAYDNGVQLHFVSRSSYREKGKLVEDFGESYHVIPEGGSNFSALAGVAEVIDEVLIDLEPDAFLAAMGTGGTVAGLLSNMNYKGKIIGVPVIKRGEGLIPAVRELVPIHNAKLIIMPNYHGGGYGKITTELKTFSAQFFEKYQIKLDSVYTAKLFMAAYDLIRNDYFKPNQQLVIYHSGGLRG